MKEPHTSLRTLVCEAIKAQQLAWKLEYEIEHRFNGNFSLTVLCNDVGFDLPDTWDSLLPVSHMRNSDWTQIEHEKIDQLVNAMQHDLENWSESRVEGDREYYERLMRWSEDV